MQNFFKKFARVVYYTFFAVPILSVLFMLWFAFWPSTGPGSEFYSLGLIMFVPIFLVVFAVEGCILLLLRRLTSTRTSSRTTDLAIITIFLVTLTIGLCYGYVNYLT